MAEDNARKREIEHLDERLAEPNLSDAAFEIFLARRARLIREQVEESGVPIDNDKS